MADRYLYMGGKVSFARIIGTITDSTTAGRFDSAYTDSALLCNSSSGSAAIFDFTDGDGNDDHVAAGETLWYRTDHYYSSGSFNSTIGTVLDDSDNQVFRLRVVSSNNLQVQYNTGTLGTPTWTQLGASIAYGSGARRVVVLRLYIDPDTTAHEYEVFIDSVSVASGTFSSALLTRADAIRCGEAASSSNWAEVLATSGINLVNSRLASIKASGAGSNSGMSGTFADVSEAVASDATVVASNTAGQRTTFAMSDLPTLPTGLAVGTEVRHAFRANNDGTSPANLKPVIRQGGVDTVGANISGLGLGYQTFLTKYTLTYAQINTAGFELGWESAA